MDWLTVTPGFEPHNRTLQAWRSNSVSIQNNVNINVQGKLFDIDDDQENVAIQRLMEVIQRAVSSDTSLPVSPQHETACITKGSKSVINKIKGWLKKRKIGRILRQWFKPKGIFKGKVWIG